MSKIRVGDTVAFRRDVAVKCMSTEIADYRGVVTGIAGEWLFMEEASGRTKVMPTRNMSRVAHNGVILELVELAKRTPADTYRRREMGA